MKKQVDFPEAQKLLRKYGVRFAKGGLVKEEKDLPRVAKKLGFPLAMKIVSEQVVHKSDAGGVELGIESEKEALEAFRRILKNVKKKAPKAKIRGIMVQKMADGVQVIVGGKIDPQFGPIILFGLGGIFVEIMKDVSIRLVPITRKDAKEMVSEIKGKAILKGARGKKAVNFKKLEGLLLNVSKFMEKEKVSELDLNPVMLDSRNALAVDVRVIR